MNIHYNRVRRKTLRTIIIGDIHGCYSELMQILELLKFSANDNLITVGDMTGRGPEPEKVVKYFRNKKNAFSTWGNHEHRYVGTLEGNHKPTFVQNHVFDKVSKSNHFLFADYFKSLPAVIETKHAIVTHARLNYSKPIDKQESFFTCAEGIKTSEILTNDKGIPYWYIDWLKHNKQSKAICVGHTQYRNVDLIPSYLYTLDTRIDRGGELSAVVFPEGKLYSVKAPCNYYEQILQYYKL